MVSRAIKFEVAKSQSQWQFQSNVLQILGIRDNFQFLQIGRPVFSFAHTYLTFLHVLPMFYLHTWGCVISYILVIVIWRQHQGQRLTSLSHRWAPRDFTVWGQPHFGFGVTSKYECFIIAWMIWLYAPQTHILTISVVKMNCLSLFFRDDCIAGKAKWAIANFLILTIITINGVEYVTARIDLSRRQPEEGKVSI